MKILTAEQMAEVDRLSTGIYKIPSILLMENAGRAVVEKLTQAIPGLTGKRVYVFCGKGNNGGDGLVAARHLVMQGASPEIFLFSDPSQFKGDALANWLIVHAMDLAVHECPTGRAWAVQSRRIPDPDVIIDALFGTGLSKPLDSGFRRVVDWVNEKAKKAFVVSVDIPSGLYANRAALAGPAVRAQLTVTFTALKPALVLAPASDCAGEVAVAPIGAPAALLDQPQHQMELVDSAMAAKACPKRPRDSHKGFYGHVYVVAGSRGKSGAALMTGLAALRSGSGLVTLWLPKCLQKDVTGKFVELMTEFLPDQDGRTSSAVGAEAILAAAAEADALVVGPGLTTAPSIRELVRKLVADSPIPVILDADGINAYAGDPNALKNGNGKPIVITPHPGEMARLLGTSVKKIQENRLETARAFAMTRRVFTILKGYQTLIAGPDGRLLVNLTGNPGMATAGSGDILAGMVARFVAAWWRKYHGRQPTLLADYLSAAVYLHGLAGDLAAEESGVESLIATDLLPHLPQAFRRVAHG